MNYNLSQKIATITKSLTDPEADVDNIDLSSETKGGYDTVSVKQAPLKYTEIPVEYWVYLSPNIPIAYVKLAKVKGSKFKSPKLIYGTVASGINTISSKYNKNITYQAILLINQTGYSWAFSNKDVQHLYISLDSVDTMNNILRSNNMHPVQKIPANLNGFVIEQGNNQVQQTVQMGQQMGQQIGQPVQQQTGQQSQLSIPQYNQMGQQNIMTPNMMTTNSMVSNSMVSNSMMPNSIVQQRSDLYPSMEMYMAEISFLKSEIATLKKNYELLRQESQTVNANTHKMISTIVSKLSGGSSGH